jgi:hypothetical protein
LEASYRRESQFNYTSDEGVSFNYLKCESDFQSNIDGSIQDINEYYIPSPD